MNPVSADLPYRRDLGSPTGSLDLLGQLIKRTITDPTIWLAVLVGLKIFELVAAHADESRRSNRGLLPWRRRPEPEPDETDDVKQAQAPDRHGGSHRCRDGRGLVGIRRGSSDAVQTARGRGGALGPRDELAIGEGASNARSRSQRGTRRRGATLVGVELSCVHGHDSSGCDLPGMPARERSPLHRVRSSRTGDRRGACSDLSAADGADGAVSGSVRGSRGVDRVLARVQWSLRFSGVAVREANDETRMTEPIDQRDDTVPAEQPCRCLACRQLEAVATR